MNYEQILPYDKALHVIVGVIIFAVLHTFSVLIALVAVLIAGIGKEVWDHYHPPHQFDFNDITATVAGGVLGFLCYIPWL